jgi:hypothetical protein
MCGLSVHPEERAEEPSKAPPATPAPDTFKKSLRVSTLLSRFPPWLVQAEQVGDARAEEGQSEEDRGTSRANE